MEERIFKRKIYERMLKWKRESNGHTALLIKGARRIGKSTIAETFARQEYESYIIIDFSIADDAVKELFLHISVPPGENGPVRSYEIDFLLSRNNKICPVEIKSSGYNSHKSLDRFHEKYSGRILQRYLVYTKDLKKDKDILCIPAYMSAMI